MANMHGWRLMAFGYVSFLLGRILACVSRYIQVERRRGPVLVRGGILRTVLVLCLAGLYVYRYDVGVTAKWLSAIACASIYYTLAEMPDWMQARGDLWSRFLASVMRLLGFCLLGVGAYYHVLDYTHAPMSGLTLSLSALTWLVVLLLYIYCRRMQHHRPGADSSAQ